MKKDEPTRAGWYCRLLSDGRNYYTPFKKYGEKYYVPGPGDRAPTPNEVVAMLQGKPHLDYCNGGYLTEYQYEISVEPEVDLPSGVYSFERGGGDLPPHLIPFKLREDSYIRIPGVYEEIAADVQCFLANEKVYRDMGAQYRRGILLYGPAGGGKTSVLRELIRNEIPKDAVVIFCDDMMPRQFIDAIRGSLKSRLKVFVFEELVAVLVNSRIEKVLDFLDGERSVDRSIVLCTTNYPEKLPGNIVDRPSRIDLLVKHPEPDAGMRKKFLEYFLRCNPVPITAFDIEQTKGLSVAALLEVARLVQIRHFPIAKAVGMLRKHQALAKKEFSETRELGFHADSREYYPDTNSYD